MLAVLTVAVVALCFLCPAVVSLNVYVRPNEAECFFESLTRGEKMLTSFIVQSGGYLDIDITVTDPANKVLYEAERQREDTFQFKASLDGAHRLCFSNSMSMVSAKVVSFHIYSGGALVHADAARAEHLTPLETAIAVTSEGLYNVHDTAVYLKYREIRHSATVESSQSRLMWWSIAECVAIISVSAFNIVYLRNLFEAKRAPKSKP